MKHDTQFTKDDGDTFEFKDTDASATLAGHHHLIHGPQDMSVIKLAFEPPKPKETV